eukprot:g10381.t1
METEQKEKASQEKEAGNAAFKAGDAVEALRRYSSALSHTPDDHLLHSNRSMALAKLGRWSESEQAAAKTVQLSPGFAKGYLRLAKAQLEQGKHSEAVRSCDDGLAAERRSSSVTPMPGAVAGGAERASVGDSAAVSKTVRELEMMAATALERLRAQEGGPGGAGAGTGTAATGTRPRRKSGGTSASPSSASLSSSARNRRESSEAGRRRESSSSKRASGAGAGIGAPRLSVGGVGGGSAAAAGAGAGGNEPPKPSIKDFRVVEELGTGNFSTIVKAEHRRTGKPFALKMIEKAEVSRLKRRHENVYNEIYMEKRALTKLSHPNIVRMHSTFQDYSTLYYLLDMCDGGEVWKRLTVDGKVVGAHPSLARFWLSEVVSAVEHMHRRGLVHRDLKPENMMLTAGGHVKLVDFGTCKDLVETDINGGEFVGTAQYMSPQAVASEEQGREADLWALGCCVYQFLAGFTPFHAPSPYLCFLRIKKGVFRCPEVLPDDATDLIKRLLRRNPASRLGAGPLTGASQPAVDVGAAKGSPSDDDKGDACEDCETVVDGEDAAEEQGTGAGGREDGGGGGFEALKAHPFFRGLEFCGDGQPLPPSVTVPKLYELCVRAVAHHMVAYADSTPLVRDPFPAHVNIHRLRREFRYTGAPTRKGNMCGAEGGSDTSGDTVSASVAAAAEAATAARARRQRGFVERVRHYLWQLSVLQRPKVHRLFHSSAVDAKSLRADTIMREYLGLDWETHGHWNEPFFFIQIADPQLGMVKANAPIGGAEWEVERERLSRLVGIVNRLRPKFLLVTGDMTHAPPGHEFYEGQVTCARQLLGKVSETIPVLYCPGNHDLGNAGGGVDDESEYVRRFGADYYSFWYGGVRGLVLNTHLWASSSADPERRRAQERWLDQELEVAQLNAHHLMVVGHHPWFLEDPYEEEHPIWTPIPRETRLRWLSKMGHCKVKFIFSGHCHRNYEARVRRPVVQKTPPRPITAVVTATPTAPDAEDAKPYGGAAPAPGGGGNGGSPDVPSADGVAAAAVDQGGGGAGAEAGGALLTRDAVAGLGGSASSSAAVAAAEGATQIDLRTAGDVDSDDAPGSISDNDEDADTSEAIDMRSVVTSSCTAPLGPDAPGFRVVRGGFVWDDRLAVVGNRDVWTDSPWGDMWHHDFWGQKMTVPGSHKSFRPLTTLTFRLSNIFAQRIAAEEQDIVTSSSQQSTEAGAVLAANIEFPTKKADAVRGAGPRHADATGFHLFNVIVHAATCSSSVWVFRAVFPGQELPAVVASLLFTVHPVHVEAVAPIVGRADLLCGLLSMIALSLTITTTRGQGRGQPSSATAPDSTLKTLPGTAAELAGQDSAPVATACAVSELSMASFRVAQSASTDPVVSSDGAGKEGGKMNQRGKGRGKTAHRTGKAGKPSRSLPPVATVARSPPWRPGATDVQAEGDAGPGMARFLAALTFAVGATLCKEIGITVFGLMAGGEVVRLFEEHDWKLRRQRRRQPGRPKMSPTAPCEVSSQNRVVMRPWWCGFVTRAPVAAAARIASALTCAGLLVVLHVRLRGGAGVREWGVLENDIAILASRKERALSYAFTHAVYAYKLLWPTKLCYDWGFSCIPHVTSLADPASIAPLTLYGSLLASAVLAVLRRDTAIMWGLALVVVPFLPASNVLFPVGAVVAERRCEDWNSERALFEAAIKVCPDGIKTLNNMAASMLNTEEAGRAEVLLLRAVELHPGYGSAMFNLGVSRMLLRDHNGAVPALEQSLELEPWNTMAMVYLDLALKALQTPSVGAAQGDHIGKMTDGTRQASVTRSSSPELLLSQAESYTDKALTAGSGLPLARLVKGQALAMRGQHKNAAEFFRSYIDISLHLLSGGGSSSRGVEGSLATSNAVDLASAYNLLGLALRDSGSDLIATKEAFLAGLSVAPDNVALLVNGGVAHQAAGDISGAKTLYHRALSLQPNSPELLNNLGWLEEQSGGGSRASLETSAGLYVRALGLMGEGSPDRAQVEHNLANVRKRLMGYAGGQA